MLKTSTNNSVCDNQARIPSSPGRAHTQQLPVSQSSQCVEQEVWAAVGEQVLRVALLVVQRAQEHAGPPQLGRCDRSGSVRDVDVMLSRQQQHLTVLTKLFVIQWEGSKLSESEGQNTTVQVFPLVNGRSKRRGVSTCHLTDCSTPAGWTEVAGIGFLLLWLRVLPRTPIKQREIVCLWFKHKPEPTTMTSLPSDQEKKKTVKTRLFILPLEKVAVLSVPACWAGVKLPSSPVSFAGFPKK